VSLLTLATSTAAPTPAVLPMASAPAMLRMPVVSLAATEIDWPALTLASTLAPLAMYARVVSLSTLTTADAAMPAEPEAAPPTASVSSVSVLDALIDRPVPPRARTSVPGPMYASTRSCRTSVVLDAPTPALEPNASPPAYMSMVALPVALSDIAPLAYALAPVPPAMKALVLVFITATDTDPEIPTELPSPAAAATE
jgi:hypothetical protein